MGESVDMDAVIERLEKAARHANRRIEELAKEKEGLETTLAALREEHNSLKKEFAALKENGVSSVEESASAGVDATLKADLIKQVDSAINRLEEVING